MTDSTPKRDDSEAALFSDGCASDPIPNWKGIVGGFPAITPQLEFTDAERAEMFDKARNANMVTLAYFTQESRRQVIEIANVVTEARDLIDAQTVVDTLSAVLDDLQHQYHAALRKRDLFRNLEAK